MAKRIVWFERGARALRQILPEASYCYLCPLCQRGFIPGALEQDLLSIEHVPPKALGGKPLVLTCKLCNSGAGATLDAAMGRIEDFYHFSAGTLFKPTRAQMIVHDAQLTVEVTRHSGNIAISVPRRANRDKDELAMDRALSRTAPERPSFQIAFHRRVRFEDGLSGWLRAAYLVAYAVLGYRYVLRGDLDIVRDQIADPRSHRMRTFSVTMDSDPDCRRVLLVDEPSWLTSLAIQMGRHLIFLPWLPSADRLYSGLAARAGQSASEDIAGISIPWPKEPEHALDFMPEETDS